VSESKTLIRAGGAGPQCYWCRSECALAARLLGADSQKIIFLG